MMKIDNRRNAKLTSEMLEVTMISFNSHEGERFVPTHHLHSLSWFQIGNDFIDATSQSLQQLKMKFEQIAKK